MTKTRNCLDQVVILAVDSHADSRDLLTILLTDYGARVISAASAAEAMAMLKTSRPDLLISEIYLPDEDGCSLMHRVRALGNGTYANLPAIALTVCAMEHERQQILAAGYCKHIAKPFDITSLVEAVAQIVATTQ